MKQLYIENVIENDYKLIVDTSSLLQDNSEYIFFEIIAPLLCLHQKQIIIPMSVYNEIHGYSLLNKIKNVDAAIKILNSFEKTKLYVINKKYDNQFVDDAIFSLFSSLSNKYNLCLITSDIIYKESGNLPQNIVELKNDQSINRKKDIIVFSINRKYNNIIQLKTNPKRSTAYNKKLFSLPKMVNNGKNKKSDIIIPEVNSYVFDENNNKYLLKKQIGRTGGEGSVYITSKEGYVCKIYKSEKNTNFKQKKIILLTKNKINIKGVCLPEFIAFNEEKEFVGYFMKQADGIELKTSIFIKPLLEKKFPHWTRLHLTIAALNILNTVKTLHEYNIILGDINPGNILIKNENKIYFIDTDSFQIEDYPCPVGMVPYTKIENHGKRYSEYLRTKDDDIFAIMTLLFQILMPGKLPYSFRGGRGERENMKPENFPYKCNCGDSDNNVPDGQWVYIWSHLPSKLKDLFCKVFKLGKPVQLYEVRITLKIYISQIREKLKTDLIFPSSFKQIKINNTYVTLESTKYKCKSCGADYFITSSDSLLYKRKGLNPPRRCNPCRKKNNIRDYSN